SGDDVTSIKRRRHDQSSDGVKIMATASGSGRLKEDLESSTVETSDDTVMDDVSKQGRIIADMDTDVDVTLKDIAKDVSLDAKIEEGADVQGRQAESQA
nr:hypothetical protein [Tanacetum cinerariifolium]